MTSSPQRQRASRTQASPITSTDLENERLRIDNEHLKTLLNGVHEKLTVFNDLKKDVDQQNQVICKSEGARDNLHTTIQRTA